MYQSDTLFKEYRKTGDKKIRDLIVVEHTYMAKILAYRFQSTGMEFDDLYQVACMGLVLSVERFDPERGVQFATFATPTIMGEIRKFLRDKATCIKIPRKLFRVFSKAESIKNGGENFTMTEIAKKLDVPLETLEEAYKVGDSAFIKSLEDEAATDGGLSVSSMIGYDDEGFMVVENRDFMKYCMSKMNEQEADLLRLRFYEDKTQREIADTWGVSQMYVSRLEKKVIKKFREIYTKDLETV